MKNPFSNRSARPSRRPHLTALALLAAAALLFPACTSPVATAPVEPGETTVTDLDSAGVRIDGIFNPDGSLEPAPEVGQTILNQIIRVEDMRAIESDAGFKRVQVRVTNRSKYGKSFEYRFIWFDQAGFEVGQGTGGWTVVPIKARETASLTGTARATDVASFQLFIREIKFKK